MKNKKVLALAVLMTLGLAAGIGGAVAAITKNAAAKTGTAAFDKAINLYWNTESATASINDITDLTVNKTVYRYLTVSPKSTKGVEGNVTLTFTMAAGATTHVNGMTVEVYKTDALLTDATVEEGLAEKTAVVTLTADHLTDSTSFAVVAAEAIQTTTAYYAIGLTYDGSSGTGELGGQITIAQSFGA